MPHHIFYQMGQSDLLPVWLYPKRLFSAFSAYNHGLFFRGAGGIFAQILPKSTKSDSLMCLPIVKKNFHALLTAARCFVES